MRHPHYIRLVIALFALLVLPAATAWGACQQPHTMVMCPVVGKTVGNRLTQTTPSTTLNSCYDTTGMDRLLATTTSSCPATATNAYDENGNETTAGSRTLDYNVANQLTSTTSGGVTGSYTYDGLSRRMAATDAGTTTNYLWDEQTSVPLLGVEQNGSGTNVRSYLYGNQPISMTNSTATFYYLHDRLGSVSNVTDSSGNLDWTYQYDPFGGSRSTTGSGPDNNIRFAGQQLDDTGLYHMGARQYDSSTGRFTSTDPLEWPVGLPYMNAYQYAFNDPTRFTDPSGAWPGQAAASWVMSHTVESDAAYAYSDWATSTPVISSIVNSAPAWDPALGLMVNANQCIDGAWKAPSDAAKNAPHFCIKAGAYGAATVGTALGIDAAGSAIGSRLFGTSLYRAVGPAELEELMATGRFAAGPNSLEGKWFAESAAHAGRWGELLNGPGGSVVRVTVRRGVANTLLRRETLDAIGPARYVSPEQLQMFNAAFRSFGVL